jgi:proline dehydrogenase
MHALNKLVVTMLPAVPRPLVRYFAGRYIAGETMQDAINTVRFLNAEGVCATLDVLGEDITTREEAIASKEQSDDVLHTIVEQKLDSNLSIKLTSLGLKLDKKFCESNVRDILTLAAEHDIFVRFDMEDSTTTSDTIEVYRSLHRDFPRTGIVMQAYLRRAAADVDLLIGERPNFRLCKGIYRESEEIAFQKREEIQQNYASLLRRMFDGGAYVGIATHDTLLVDAAATVIQEKGLRRDQYEFQMLLGVRPDLRRRLVREGHKVRLYVPFGEHWYGYSMRRFQENPAVAGYVVKALFVRNR